MSVWKEEQTDRQIKSLVKTFKLLDQALPEAKVVSKLLVAWHIHSRLSINICWIHELIKSLYLLSQFIYLFIYLLAVLCVMLDLSSPTRDRTWAPYSGSMES